MASNPAQKTEETTSIQGQSGENFEIRGGLEEANMVESLSEIGGIALGAVAFLVPGLGPVLSGGPVAGLAVGDTVGHYMSAQMGLEREEEQGQQQSRQQQGQQSSRQNQPDAEREQQGSFFLSVDTYSPQEADFASNIMEQHGGKVTRMTINEEESVPEQEEVRYIPSDADTRYVAETDAPRPKTQEIPSSLRILQDAPKAPAASINEQHDLPDLQGIPVEPNTQYVAQTDADIQYAAQSDAQQETAEQMTVTNDIGVGRQGIITQGQLYSPPEEQKRDDDSQNAQFPQFPAFPQNERTIPAQDGYELDPVAPLSPQNWIDPNIGLGNYDLYDPATRSRDNSQPPEDGNSENSK
ncbi:hypothetical protein CBW65_15585 [Tumebacillus avium]|uniref:Uncharacterized protein n=1 Tax=Tumebacillus avium TaxID=1903704 RepID=A0A1Y0ISF1_9BACL|nr:hypothetical protein [Tumebacillus avium]ARU62274.1 hypothetical protein CBW65_15585 [Tumebacillus avium]